MAFETLHILPASRDPRKSTRILVCASCTRWSGRDFDLSLLLASIHSFLFSPTFFSLPSHSHTSSSPSKRHSTHPLPSRHPHLGNQSSHPSRQKLTSICDHCTPSCPTPSSSPTARSNFSQTPCSVSRPPRRSVKRCRHRSFSFQLLRPFHQSSLADPHALGRPHQIGQHFRLHQRRLRAQRLGRAHQEDRAQVLHHHQRRRRQRAHDAFVFCEEARA